MTPRRLFLALLLSALGITVLNARQAGRTAPTPAPHTGLVYSDVYLTHLSDDSGHPEKPERLTAIMKGLEKSGLATSLTRIPARRATDDELALVHERSYLDLVRRELSALTVERNLTTGDTLASPGTYEAAHLAVGGVLNAVDAVMDGRVKNAFCAVRPPGHHATPSRGMGFCVYNNVAIAARYLQQKHGVRRVLIVDWDYHHGNGTQDTFYGDGSVFYFSTHHWGAYPGTGAPDERGVGSGLGATLNIAMPTGAGDRRFIDVFERQLAPAARQFKPDFILVSAGFDSMRNDLLGHFDVTPAGYTAMTRIVKTLADELCGGRIVSVLEGGYRLDGLADSVAAHVRVLGE